MAKPYPGLQLRQAKLAKFPDGTYTIKLQFPFSPDDVANVKTLQGRKWYPDGRFWTAYPTIPNLDALKSWDFVIDKKLVKFIDGNNRYPALPPIEGLKKKLFPYQHKGVEFLQARNGRGLIGDEMGLGKTVQAIAWMHLNPKISPVVIVVPASIKLNWAREIREWTDTIPSNIMVLNGTTPYPLAADIIIINYDILSAWLTALLEYKPMAVIGDEIQLVKNNKAKRTKAMKKLAKHVPHFVALSGTPIVNRPIEFFNAIQMVDKNVMPNWQLFTKKYCAPKHNGFGWNYNGASNTEELHEILTSTIMIRRTKKEVLPELPDKIRSFFPLEMDEALAEEYDQAEINFLAWIRDKHGADAAEKASAAAALTEIETLKQIAVRSKLDHAMEWTENFLDSGQKLVVFAVHKFVIDAFMQKFGKLAVKIDGSVSGTNRQLAVDKFQNDAKTRLFVGNIKAAGVGITLTAASNVAYMELPWSPGDLSQSEDRCHRIGQHDSVNIYYLLAEYTIEEKIAALLDEKRKVLDAVLDGKQTEDDGLIMELIESYTE